jgi:hypothetical protein
MLLEEGLQGHGGGNAKRVPQHDELAGCTLSVEPFPYSSVRWIEMA